jgi:transposase
LDETAVQLFMHRNYARCSIGERCSITTTSNTVLKSYTLLVAISSSKVVGWKLYEEGGTNEERLIDFVNQFITSKYRDHLVIMDNAPSHRKETVKQAIEKNSNKLLKSIPFYPRSNAVENFFSQLKHYMRDEKIKTFQELSDTIKKVIDTKIPVKSLENYFKFAYGEKPEPVVKEVKKHPYKTLIYDTCIVV